MNNFFKPMMLMMAFAMATFSFSNQSFAADISVVGDYQVCTVQINTTPGPSFACDANGTTYTVTASVTVTTSGDPAGATVNLQLDDGASAEGAQAITGEGETMYTFTFPGQTGTTGTFTLDATLSATCGSNTTDSEVINRPTTDPCDVGACTTCYANNETIEDAMPGADGGELCGGDETFTGNGTLNTDGTITGGRTVTIEAATAVVATEGTVWDASGGGMITVTVGASVSCLTDPNGEVSRKLVVDNNNVEVGVKVTPNPFSSSATIDYNLDTEGEVLIRVFNMKGEPVAVLANGIQVAGQHSVSFDAANLPKGFYYLSLQTSTEQVTEQMVIMR